MSARDDLARAASEARAQIEDAKHALASSRAKRAGGPARSAREAEQQLHALRGAIADDLRSLRGQARGLDPTARRGARTAAIAGVTGLVGLVGAGLAARGAVNRGSQRRTVQRQALALAAALADQAAFPAVTSPGTRTQPRTAGGRRGTAFTLLAVGAAVAAAAVAQRRRTAPIDPDDLWLPERTVGPA
jgi:hypothetical protein